VPQGGALPAIKSDRHDLEAVLVEPHDIRTCRNSRGLGLQKSLRLDQALCCLIHAT
jgi:hypothetical protein